MLTRSPQYYAARAKVAKALGHPSRLLMLEALRSRERSVGELTGIVAADQSTVSKHLAVLRHAGLVDVRREGTTIYYRVCCDCLDGLFRCVESIVRQSVAAQACRIR